jgi:starvation-inducible DNA-binding protein
MRNSRIQLEFVETENDSDLVEAMRSLFADTVIFYLKAHGYHWNVEGPDFGPFHKLFEGIYEEVYGTVDDMAEHVRKLDAFAIYTIAMIEKYRTLSDTPLTGPQPLPMVQDLLLANEMLLSRIAVCFKLAEAKGEQGLMNYLADRTDAHRKHGWFLRATVK